MPTTAWTSFLDHVIPDLPSCPESMALNAVKEASQRFYRDAKLYLWMHPAINVVNATHTYAFAPPAGYLVDEIIKDACWYDGRKIYPRAPLALNEMYVDWQAATGTPRWFTQESERAVRLVPIPTVDLTAGLKFWTWLKPALTGPGIETEHFEDYHLAIAHAAKAMLMEVPTKPYSNPQLAMYHWGRYDEKMKQAAQRVNRGRVDDGELTMVVER